MKSEYVVNIMVVLVVVVVVSWGLGWSLPSVLASQQQINE
jgi:hypothetical protein